MASDPLEDVFTMEDRFYTDGYNQGLKDGAKAGRIEGRSFGMEKGFEKFCESGRLASKALIWANRLPQKPKTVGDDAASGSASSSSSSSGETCTLPPLPGNARLEKNIRLLYALVEPETLSTANTDESVQDFDDRFKRAQGKAKIVERMVG